MSNIAQFIANLRGGGARPNRFEVVIEFPAFAGTANEIRQSVFLVNSTSLPGSTLGVIEHPFRGRTIKLAGDRVFDEWEATFVNDTDFGLRDAFERWHNGINSYSTNRSSIPENYFSNVSVYQLDSNDRRIKTYNMKMAWPSVVAPIELAQDQNDVLELFSVTFAFSDIDNGNSN